MKNIRLSLHGVPHSIWSHPVETSRQEMGRLSECPIHLLHASVSRRHAVVWRVGDDELCLQDLGSRNGTFINGERISRRTFLPGDIIQLGKVMLDAVVDDSTDVMLDRPTKPITDPVGIDTIDISMEALSEAQLRVLRVLLTGKSEKEVAESLHLSPHTVHSHVRAIYHYYGVNSRATLMAHFIQLATTRGETESGDVPGHV